MVSKSEAKKPEIKITCLIHSALFDFVDTEHFLLGNNPLAAIVKERGYM